MSMILSSTGSGIPVLLAIAGGGALGSVARYLAGIWMLPVSDGFPFGTLFVNVLGAFLIGIFARIAINTEASLLLRLALTTGFCGGFTTFSTLSAETITMIQEGRIGRAGLYVALSIILGLTATFLGLLSVKPRISF